MTINEIASAIYNDVVSGLRGITSTPTMSIEQLENGKGQVHELIEVDDE